MHAQLESLHHGVCSRGVIAGVQGVAMESMMGWAG